MCEAIRKAGRAFGRALFLDIPFLIDSRWRHIEYALCAESNYRPGQHEPPARRAFVRKPPFWLFAITAFYVTYGPTRGSLCAILPAPTPSALWILFWGMVAASVALGLWLLITELPAMRYRIEWAEKDEAKRGLRPASPMLRRCVVGAAIFGAVALLIWLGVTAKTMCPRSTTRAWAAQPRAEIEAHGESCSPSSPRSSHSR